jgi:hypothetical protein
MSEYDDLARAVERAGYEVFWQGAASSGEVERLESMLGVALPKSFRRFLEEYGGGGVVSAEISGIENKNPQFYELLALFDSLRIGQAREREMARTLLESVR